VKHRNNQHRNFDDIIRRLLKLPLGCHYLISYANIETVRKIYAEYVRFLIEGNNVAILFLLLYDTIDKVRQELTNKGIDVRTYERNNSLTLIDFAKVIDNPYLGIPTAFGLNEFINKIQIFCNLYNFCKTLRFNFFFWTCTGNTMLF
jgi:hypothetical protein